MDDEKQTKKIGLTFDLRRMEIIINPNRRENSKGKIQNK
jgi:hypothetical protein